MERTINERVRILLEYKGVSITSMSKAIGIPQPTLNRQVSTDTLSLSTVEAILEHYTDVSAEWLMRGEGNILKSDVNQNYDNEQKVSEEEASALHKAVYRMTNIQNNQMEDIRELQNEVKRMAKTVEALANITKTA